MIYFDLNKIDLDESINIDPGSDSDEEDNDEGGDILVKMLSPQRQNNKSIFHKTQRFSVKTIKDNKKEIPSKTIDLVKNMSMPSQVLSTKHQSSAKDQEKQNPFMAKKTGFASTLSKVFKNFL